MFPHFPLNYHRHGNPRPRRLPQRRHLPLFLLLRRLPRAEGRATWGARPKQRVDPAGEQREIPGCSRSAPGGRMPGETAGFEISMPGTVGAAQTANIHRVHGDQQSGDGNAGSSTLSRRLHQPRKSASSRQHPWLRKLREEGFARFGETGFPTVRDEDWRFTNLAAIARTPFRLVREVRDLPSQSDSRRRQWQAHRRGDCRLRRRPFLAGTLADRPAAATASSREAREANMA